MGIRGKVVLAVVAVLVVAGGIVFNTGLGTDDTSPAARTPTRSTSQVPPCAGCFPGADLTAVVAEFEAQGLKCSEAEAGMQCRRGDDRVIDLQTAFDKSMVSSFNVQTFDAKADAKQAVASTTSETRSVLAVLLPGQPALQQKLADWFGQNLATCAQEGAIDGYQVSCTAPKLISAGKEKHETRWASWSAVTAGGS